MLTSKSAKLLSIFKRKTRFFRGSSEDFRFPAYWQLLVPRVKYATFAVAISSFIALILLITLLLRIFVKLILILSQGSLN